MTNISILELQLLCGIVTILTGSLLSIWAMANQRRREDKMQDEKLEQRGPRKGENDRWNRKNKNIY